MKQKPKHIFPFVGKLKDKGSVQTLPDVLIMRKGIEKHHLKRYAHQYQRDINKTFFVAFVSSPYIYVNPLVRSMVKVWLHPFRNPKKHLPDDVPSYLISESDFVDPKMLMPLKEREIKWDYFYFTIGGGDGINHKGYKVFRKTLAKLSHLQGHIIIYGKIEKFPKSELSYLKSKGLKVTAKTLKREHVQNIMRRSRFGFFPNIQDCSPRMIPECLLHNTPVLVNDDILGGWKYINDNTGRLFSQDTVTEGVDFVMDNKNFCPKKDFMSQYGFANSSRNLAKILSDHHPVFEKYEMVYFDNYKDLMKKI